MSMYNKVALFLGCMLALLFAGCTEQTIPPATTEGEKHILQTTPTSEPVNVPTLPVSTEILEQAVVLDFGSLEYERLPLTVWNSGRLALTSHNRMVETETGYYYLLTGTGIMYYADKTDLSTWVPVCGKPDCNHGSMNSRCNAFCGGREFLLKDERIYFAADLKNFPELYTTEANGFGLFSRAANGSDIRLEYVIEEALVTAGSAMDFLTDTYWMYDIVSLQTDGSYTATSYLATENGLQVIYEEHCDDFPSYSILFAENHGDPTFLHAGIGAEAYAYESNQLVELKHFAQYLDTVHYRSGKYIRVFREGDGFYDVDLETGEEAYVTGVNLEHSRSYVLLPNCIVETSLSADRPDRTENRFLLFDGEAWREVELPPELLDAPNSIFFGVIGVSSDSLFCQVNNRNKITLYRIPLGAGKLVMELCAQIG